jgi:hypothetical protein
VRYIKSEGNSLVFRVVKNVVTVSAEVSVAANCHRRERSLVLHNSGNKRAGFDVL